MSPSARSLTCSRVVCGWGSGVRKMSWRRLKKLPEASGKPSDRTPSQELSGDVKDKDCTQAVIRERCHHSQAVIRKYCPQTALQQPHWH